MSRPLHVVASRAGESRPIHSPPPRRRRRRGDRATLSSERALFDFLMLRRSEDPMPSLAEARARVDALRGTTSIVELRRAALLEARAALELAAALPAEDLIDEDDLIDP